MERNVYMDHLRNGIEPANPVTLDSIESTLSHISDLHNTMGKSYDHLTNIISALLKSLKDNETERENHLKELKDQKNEVSQLQGNLHSLENELAQSREKIIQLQKEGEKKDDIIHQLNNQLDLVNAKISASPPTDFSYMKSRFETKSQKETPKEVPKDTEPRFEGFSRTEEPPVAPIKRRYGDLLQPELPGLGGVDEMDEDSKSSSTVQRKEEESANFDDFKFKKDFKKVKRTENSKKEASSGHSTSTPFPTVNTKRKAEVVPTLSSQLMSLDADNSLHNLLNNFTEHKETPAITVNKKKSDSNKKLELADLMQDETEKLIPNAESPESPRLDIVGAESKSYSRKGGFAFSQKSPSKSPLKSLENFDLANNAKTSVPIARNGRIGNSSNLMQRMMIGNKKRTSVENNAFKMSAKRDSFTQDDNPNRQSKPYSVLNALTAFNNDDEELVRATYRSKAEREGLKGFDCNECAKFYNFIADGTRIKADQMCDNCSRHRGKFALPSTPEKFHDNFSLNTQD